MDMTRADEYGNPVLSGMAHGKLHDCGIRS